MDGGSLSFALLSRRQNRVGWLRHVQRNAPVFLWCVSVKRWEEYENEAQERKGDPSSSYVRGCLGRKRRTGGVYLDGTSFHDVVNCTQKIETPLKRVKELSVKYNLALPPQSIRFKLFRSSQPRAPSYGTHLSPYSVSFDRARWVFHFGKCQRLFSAHSLTQIVGNRFQGGSGMQCLAVSDEMMHMGIYRPGMSRVFNTVRLTLQDRRYFVHFHFDIDLLACSTRCQCEIAFQFYENIKSGSAS